MKRFLNKNLIIFGFLACLLLAVFLFLPQTAHAQSLHQDLTRGGSTPSTQQWIFTVWATMLGLADVIIVLVLLVIAVVNILHLQYDTYALKKSLPLLIGGIIASHFSILICRMIVDASGVLSQQFMGADPREFVKNLLCTVGIGDPISGHMTFLFMVSGAAGLSLIAIILLTLFLTIAIGVLSFLLWIRKTLIFLLVAISPLAFILYAFPPTQGLFKQWWSQFMQWVFMGPVMIAIMWVASQIGASTDVNAACPPFNLNAALAAGGLMFAASIVPSKMGGAIMSSWGGLGKWAGKKALGAADYGLAKKTGWSPTAAYQAYKLNNSSKRESALAQATANQRDLQNKISGQKTEFGRITRKMIAQKQDKEGPGGVGLGSLSETVNAFNTAILNDQNDLAMMYMQKIGENYMGEDAIDFLSDDARNKLGYKTGYEKNDDGSNKLDDKGQPVRVKLNHDIDGQRGLLEKLGADDREVAQYEDNLYKAGHVGAMTRLLDKKTGKFYHEKDQDLLATINIARTGSTEPGKLVNNTRWQSFFNDNGELTKMGEKLLDEKNGIFQAAHMPFIRRGRGRPNVYNRLTRPENWNALDQINPALKDNIEAAGYHPGWEIENSQTIKVGKNKVDISKLDSELSKDVSIQRQIITEVKKLPSDNAAQLANNVFANTNFDRRFAQMVTNISDLKRAVKNTSKLSEPSITRDDTETTIHEIIKDGTNVVGNGMRQDNLDPRFVVQGILNEAPQDRQEQIFSKLKESMKNSHQVATQLGTRFTTMSEIINAYEDLNKPDSSSGGRPDESAIRQKWFNWAQNQGANSHQASKAWALVEAYLGKPAPKVEPTITARNDEDEDLFYEDSLDDVS